MKPPFRVRPYLTEGKKYNPKKLERLGKKRDACRKNSTSIAKKKTLGVVNRREGRGQLSANSGNGFKKVCSFGVFDQGRWKEGFTESAEGKAKSRNYTP